MGSGGFLSLSSFASKAGLQPSNELLGLSSSLLRTLELLGKRGFTGPYRKELRLLLGKSCIDVLQFLLLQVRIDRAKTPVCATLLRRPASLTAREAGRKAAFVCLRLLRLAVIFGSVFVLPEALLRGFLALAILFAFATALRRLFPSTLGRRGGSAWAAALPQQLSPRCCWNGRSFESWSNCGGWH